MFVLARLAFAIVFLCPIALSQTFAGQSVPGRFIVTYRSGAIPGDAATSALLAGGRLVQRHERLGMVVVAGPASMRQQLLAQDGVEMVVADRIVNAHAITVRTAGVRADADTAYHSQQGWAVRQVGGFGADETDPLRPGPWDVSKGEGVRIAILDTGVDASHPDIAPNLALNMTEIDQTALPSVCDDGQPWDQQGHGTWTASLAAGALGSGTGVVAGVAPQATLLNIKVLQRMPGTVTATDPTGCNSGQASGLLSWVIQGIEDAVANRADVISLSLGTLVDITTGDGAGLKATFDHATHAAFVAGAVVIAAAGNDGFNLGNPRYIELPAQARDVVAIVASTNPACAENVAAGATCAAGPVTMPYYSNYGAPLNALAAPGGSYPAGPAADPSQAMGWILGGCSNGKPSTLSGAPVDGAHSMGCFGLGHAQYVQAMGTSASAPLVAGVVALLKASHPGLDATGLVGLLRSSAVTSGGMAVAQVTAVGAVVPSIALANPIVVP